jgi:hypothetical protein
VCLIAACCTAARERTRMEEIMKQLGLSIVIAASLTFPALADPSQLRGDYVWTYNDTCFVSPSGFSAPPGLAPGGASALGQTYPSSAADTGIEHFDPNGTGYVRGSGTVSVSLGQPPNANVVLAGIFSFQFTYTFISDDTFIMTTVPGTFIGRDSTGKASIMLTGNQWVGKLSQDGKSHTLTTVTPFVQAITSISPPTILSYQMCRSNVVGFAAD